MGINPQIFKGYDIRGVYPTDLNEENIVPIIKAIYTFLSRRIKQREPLTIVVGTDMRISSPFLTKKAIETLVSMGVNVVDISMVGTPTFYFAVHHYGYESGIQITASHNPKEWNGIKIVKRGKKGLIKIGQSTGLEEIKQMALKGQFATPNGEGKVTQRRNVVDDEVEQALRIAGNPSIKHLRIVADAANAMGSQYLDALFQKLPVVELIRINFMLDGTFPAHQPDPLQKETLVDLQKRVVNTKANLGLAPDGDGDRLFFIDERGEIVPSTIITSIVTAELLKKYPRETIFVDIRYIFTPKKTIEENGGRMMVTKVGHAYITEAMNETGGIFAGESSGHYFFKDTGNAEAPMPVILTVLKVLTETEKSLSQLTEEYRRSYESGEINFKVTNAKRVMERIKESYQDGTLDKMDGIALNFPNWRFSVRPSNTEPLLRLNVESYQKNVMLEKRDELIELIES